VVRVAFLGTPAVAVPVLRALAGETAVAAVFCNPDKPQGRGRHLEAPPVKTCAEELGLAVHQPASWKSLETKALWESLRVDLAIVVAYGHILPGWMLDACSWGAWNLHFSVLPRWRGAAPVNHAILAGDEETGVSLMGITRGLDAGPVVALSRRPITLHDTAEGLLPQLAEDAAQLLRANLSPLLSGTVVSQPQDDALATLAPKLKVCGVGGLKPSGLPPGSLSWDRGGAWLTTGDEQALELTFLQRPGKPVQPALQALQPWGSSGIRALGS
jgi:methionyl-tRNA formyltransferase